MAYDLVTKNGHNMYDMASMMQKAIRRNNPNLAGYAAYELFGNFHTYMWKRLVVVSAEDCYGIMTKEVIALKLADDFCNKGRKNNVIAKTIGFGLRRKLESLAHLTRKLTVKEWKKAIKATLGIDIREDYYLGDFYVEQLKKWVEENVGLISSIPEDTLEKMKDIVYDGFTNGKTTTRMVKEIQRAYGISRRRAELIARDQTAKLNGQIQKTQQQDAGITEYVWSTTGDERVRRSHRELNGKKFSWDDPPENSDGRKCHPGQDFQCRCIGRPVFNRNINLPVADDEPAQITIKRNGG